MKRILNLLLVIGFLLPITTNSQIVSFVKYGVENGLAQSQIQCVSQDAQGRLWVGTMTGLSIYDGISFQNKSQDDSLAEDYITKIFKDSQGNMWVGHWGGSITRYDNETDEFENLHIERFNQFAKITDFVEDLNNNRVIFSTNGSGLFYFQRTENDIVKKIIFSDSTESKHITCLYVDSEKNLWIGTESMGIYVFAESDLSGNEVNAINLNIDNGMPSNSIADIEEYDGKIWISTPENGIARIIEKEALELVRKDRQSIKIDNLKAEDGLRTDKISEMVHGRGNEFWVGTKNRGVIRIHITNGKYHYQHYGIAEGLSFYNINTVFKDRENSIWIGTDVGLNQYISDYFLLYDKNVGLSNNIVWSICPDNEGNVWLGTNSGVTKLIDAGDPEKEDFKVSQVLVEGLNDVGVYEIFLDSEGNMWFSTTAGDLIKRNKSGSFQKIGIDQVFKDLIYSINEDNNGNIWLGTRAGAAKLNKQTNDIEFYDEDDGMGGNNVYKVVKDDDGNMWFAVNGYLSMYDGNEWKTFTEEDGIQPIILSAAKDNDGNLWFGVYSGGLYKYDGNTFENFNTEDGMKAQTAYAIQADRDNNIWFGTNYGVERFNQESGTFYQYGRAEGFLGVEVNYNALAKDAFENLWFGTILGAVRYSPYEDFKNPIKPMVKIPDLFVDRDRFDFPYDNEFQPIQNNLTFGYYGVSLNNSNKVRYQVKLDGYEDEWSKPTADRKVFFSNLDPNEYSLRIKATNSYGVESEEAVYDFKIIEPFYMSNLFYGLQFLLIVLMLVFAIYFGRKTGGSRFATVLASIAVIIAFEYGINFLEDSAEAYIGQAVFIKVLLNVLLGLALFPVEQIIKKMVVGKGTEIDTETDSISADPAS